VENKQEIKKILILSSYETPRADLLPCQYTVYTLKKKRFFSSSSGVLCGGHGAI